MRRGYWPLHDVNVHRDPASGYLMVNSEEAHKVPGCLPNGYVASGLSGDQIEWDDEQHGALSTRLRRERDEARADYLSLRTELATIFGPVKPRAGESWNAAMLGRIGATLVDGGYDPDPASTQSRLSATNPQEDR